MSLKILITGGSGMVGRNLLEHPRLSQHELFAPTSRELNLLDPAQTHDYVADLVPDLVIHAAGHVGGIQANIREPVRFLLDNLNMGQNIVTASVAAGVGQLLNLGSSCMYPRGFDAPLTEGQVLTGELEPTNEGYALAKIVTARLCNYLARQDAGSDYKTLIPCNLYGRFDHFDLERSHLIPAVIRKLHEAKDRGDTEVEIWGDGTARREFMYAGDLADAVCHVAERYREAPPVMNIGVGEDHSVDDYYRVVADVVGYTGGFRHDTSRPVGMARKLVDTAKQRAFGWASSVTLRQGIEEAYAFFLENEARDS